MLAYAFETITDEQALNIGLGDTLTFNGGPARAVGVAYQGYDPLALSGEVPKILVTFEGRTVAFGTGLTQLSDVGAIVMADASVLRVGDAGDERLCGGAGDDALYGGPGADTLLGGAGDDRMQGSAGDDVLFGGGGADTLHGGQGEDLIHVGADAAGGSGGQGGFANGNRGNDAIRGGAGDDTLRGGQGADFVSGGDGDDLIFGDRGSDKLFDGLGADLVFGGDDNDLLEGGFGADSLHGGAGDDRLVGQGPDSTLLDGGEGDDILIAASAGRDLLFGGAGRDRFEIIAKSPPSEGQDDVIGDWEACDTLSFWAFSIYSILPRQYSEFVAADYASALAIASEHISAAGATWVAAQVGHDVIVFADTGDPADGADTAVVLTGRTLDEIGLANFV